MTKPGPKELALREMAMMRATTKNKPAKKQAIKPPAKAKSRKRVKQ